MMPGRIFAWPLGKYFGGRRELALLTEIAGHPDEVFLRQLLVGKYDHDVIEPRLVDRLDGRVVRLLAQIDAAQLGTDVPGQRDGLNRLVVTTFMAFLGFPPALRALLLLPANCRRLEISSKSGIGPDAAALVDKRGTAAIMRQPARPSRPGKCRRRLIQKQP